MFGCYLNKSQTVTGHNSGWYSNYTWKLYTCAECKLHCTLVHSILSGASTWINQFNSLIVYYLIILPFFLVVNGSKNFWLKGQQVINKRSSGYHQKVSRLSSKGQQVIIKRSAGYQQLWGHHTNRMQLYAYRFNHLVTAKLKLGVRK